jgi:hypothetical protein
MKLLLTLQHSRNIYNFLYNVYYVFKYFTTLLLFFEDFHIHGFCNRVRIYGMWINDDDDDDDDYYYYYYVLESLEVQASNSKSIDVQ